MLVSPLPRLPKIPLSPLPTLPRRPLRIWPSMIPPFGFSKDSPTSNRGQVYLATRRTPRVFFDTNQV